MSEYITTRGGKGTGRDSGSGSGGIRIVCHGGGRYFSCTAREDNENIYFWSSFRAYSKLLNKTVCVVGLGYFGLPLVQKF